MTMAQFAEQLPTIGQLYFHSPVLDSSELKGAWDFSLTYSLVPPNLSGAGGGGRELERKGSGGASPPRPEAAWRKQRNRAPPFRFSMPSSGRWE
jgi:uncharacterized protein (TIGR03435 family)